MEYECFIIKIPNPNSKIANALDSSIGLNITQRYSLDKSMVGIRTTKERIQSIVRNGVDFDKIFPPGLTTKLPLKEFIDLLNTDEWQNNEEL